MNRPPSSQRTRRAAQKSAGLTPQQVIILAIVAALGFSALGLSAYALLSQAPGSPPPAQPQPQAAASAIPASTLTPGAPGALPPSLPAACLERNSGIQQGKSARVINGGTLEAQVDGNPLQIRFAGIQVPGSGPLNDQAAEAARALIEGQDILLAQDPGTTGSGSEPPQPRYVVINGQFLNLELVRQGLGQTDPNAPEQICANAYLQAEQQARAEKIGLWQPKRVPTATFIPFVTLDPALSAPCDCISRPVCSDFHTHDKAQACYNACNDYNSKLDEDRDGIACEELP